MAYLRALGRLALRAHNSFWWEVAYMLGLVRLHRAIIEEMDNA
jgi:hypothetical protein